MSNTAPSGRVGAWIAIAVIAALALGSYWLLEVMRKDRDETVSTAPRNQPDYYVDKFNYVRLSKTGQARYSIAGQKLIHHPNNDTYEIQTPVIKSLTEGRPPMTMHADRALVEPDSSKVHMYDNVHIDRPASKDAEHLHIQSDYLLILPDDDVMQTDKPVQITFDRSTLTGTGMYANNATREFRLAANVHGTYPAPQR